MEEIKNEFEETKNKLRKELLCALSIYLNGVYWLHHRANKICRRGKAYEKLNLVEIEILTKNIDSMDDECRNIWSLAGKIEVLFEDNKISMPYMEISDEFREEIQRPLHLVSSMFEVLLQFNKFSKEAIYRLYEGVQCYGETKRTIKLLKKRLKYIREISDSTSENKIEE